MLIQWSSRIVIISRAYMVYAGRDRVTSRRMLFKMLFIVHCNFEKGSQNEHFKSKLTLLVGREGGRGVTIKNVLHVCS